MLTSPPDGGTYRQWLKRIFLARKKLNRRYSLRKFSRDLAVSPTVLSNVLRNKRHLSVANAKIIFSKLGLSPLEQNRYLQQILIAQRVPRIREEFKKLKDDEFQLIADWYHFAILNLAKLTTNSCDPSWIAERLNISEKEAGDAIERLIRMDLLEKENGCRLRRKSGNLATSNDIPSQALQSHHGQLSALAQNALKQISLDLREFQASTIPICIEHIPAAKKLIRKFHLKIRKAVESETLDEVYCLNIQFFPLSHSKPSKGIKV